MYYNLRNYKTFKDQNIAYLVEQVKKQIVLKIILMQLGISKKTKTSIDMIVIDWGQLILIDFHLGLCYKVFNFLFSKVL